MLRPVWPDERLGPTEPVHDSSAEEARRSGAAHGGSTALITVRARPWAVRVCLVWSQATTL